MKPGTIVDPDTSTRVAPAGGATRRGSMAVIHSPSTITLPPARTRSAPTRASILTARAELRKDLQLRARKRRGDERLRFVVKQVAVETREQELEPAVVRRRQHHDAGRFRRRKGAVVEIVAIHR